MSEPVNTTASSRDHHTNAVIEYVQEQQQQYMMSNNMANQKRAMMYDTEGGIIHHHMNDHTNIDNGGDFQYYLQSPVDEAAPNQSSSAYAVDMDDYQQQQQQLQHQQHQQHQQQQNHFYAIAPNYKKESVGNYTMARVIEIQFDELEICNPSVLNDYRRLRFFMHLSQYKRKKSIKSPIIDLQQNKSQKVIPFTNIFHIQYIHHIRKRTDSFQIVLKAQGKKKNEFKAVSSVSINLSHVMQRPLEDTVVFRARSRPMSNVLSSMNGTTVPTPHNGDSSDEDDIPVESPHHSSHYLPPDSTASVVAPSTTAAATTNPVNIIPKKELMSNNANSGSSSPVVTINPSIIQFSGQSNPDMYNILAKLKVTVTTRPLTVEYQHYLLQQQMQQEARHKKKKINLLKWGKKMNDDTGTRQGKRDDSDNELDDSDDQYGSDDAHSSGSDKGGTAISNEPSMNKKNALARNLIKGWQFLKHKGVRERNEEDYDDYDLDNEENTNKKSLSVRLKKNRMRVQSPFYESKDLAKEDPSQESPRVLQLSIEEQLNHDFNISEYSKKVIRRVVLISSITKQSRLLAHYLKRSQGAFRNSILVTSSYEDVVQSLSKILQNNNRVRKNIDYEQDDDEQIQLAMIGTDRYVNSVLRACLQLTDSSKQLFGVFRFYLIPIPQHHTNKNSIANHIGAESSQYCEMFDSKAWHTALSLTNLYHLAHGADCADSDSLIEKNIQSYIQSAHQFTEFNISQVVIDTDTKDHSEGVPSEVSSQTTIPCISRVELSSGDLARKYSETRQSKLFKRVQNVLSPTSQDALDLPSRERRSSATPEHDLEYLSQSQMQYDDERREDKDMEDEDRELRLGDRTDKNSEFMELKIDCFINKSKQTMKHHFQSVCIYKMPVIHGDLVVDPAPNTFALCTSRKPQALPLTSKQKSNTVKLEVGIHKIVCKVESRKRPHICARIDGVQWHGVKFLSISPQWVGGLRFCVAHFGATQGGQRVARSLKDARSISSIDLRVESDEELGV